MASVVEHYEHHLADCYSWLFGGTEANMERNRDFFRQHAISPRGSGKAIDLGAGPGFQSVPLAEAGFSVTAVDLSEKLLAELETNAKKLPVATVKQDMLEYLENHPGGTELAVCMGDTLTHLESEESIQAIFREAYRVLEDRGRLVLTFRDLSHELKGLDRFVPVRSDDDRVFTCFLEYEDKAVNVHDIVYERTGNGWILKKSVYRKTRLSHEWAVEKLEKENFRIGFSESEKGFVTLIAEKRLGGTSRADNFSQRA